MRRQAFIGDSILRRTRSLRMSAIVRFTLAIVIAGGISGMVGAFRVEGSKHMTTRTAPGADIEWTRSSSEAPILSSTASQVLPGQVQWPVGDVPTLAQRAVA